MNNLSKNSISQQSITVKAALYSRVSTEEQASHGVSLAEQKERLELLAKLENWQVYDTYQDEGVSGGTDDRPELQRLMADARANRINLVAVTKLDRFFRNNRLMLNYLHELESYGVSFIAQSENIDTRTPGIGKIILNMFGSMAEWERDRIGQRISDFRQHLANKGQWSSGRTPFGYRFNKETKQLIIDPLEADAVKFIFNTYTSQQIGIIRTAELANKEGFITPRAGRRKHTTWTQSAIRHVLTHPAYKGGPNDNWQFNCPALVSPELWESTQRQLNSNRHFREAEGHNPFTGLLRCGLCGHTLRIGYNHNASQVWECPGRLKRLHLDGSPRCTLPRQKAQFLTENIINHVVDIFSNPDTLKKYINDTIKDLEKEKLALERRLKPIQANINRVNEAMKKADTMYELGRLSSEDYKARINGLRKQLKELEQKTTEADPLLLRQLSDNKEALEWYETIPERVNNLVESGAEIGLKPGNTRYAMYLLSYAFSKPREKLTGFDGKMIWGVHEAGISDYLRQYGLFIYIHPDKIEIKGAIRQTNISSAYSQDISIPLSIKIGGSR